MADAKQQTIDQDQASSQDLTVEQKSPIQQLQSPPDTVAPIVSDLPNPEGVKQKDAPVVVSEADVESVADNSERLTAQIENLTGEIQALEAKLERLAGNATPMPTTSAPLAGPSSALPPVPAPEKKGAPLIGEVNASVQAQSEKPQSAQPVQPSQEMAPQASQSPAVNIQQATGGPGPKGSAINDIYSRLSEQHKEDREKIGAAAKNENLGDLTSEGEGSVAGTISEIVAVIGILIFLGMVASGFFKSQIGDIYATLRTIGWLSSVGVIGLGFIISLFAKGRGSLKILMVLFLALAAVMYLGVTTSYLGFLDTILGSFFDLYR